MLDFLRSEGIDEEMLARIEDFRRSFPAAPENAGRIPCPKYKYYGCEVWREAIAAVLAGENLLLVGPKATGKNVLAENLAAVFQRPQWDISFYLNTDAASLIGTDTFKNGEVTLRRGPIYQCAVEGGFGVLDEINMAKNESLSVLHATLDFRRIIDVPGYDRITLSPCTRFIATMNYGYAGTRELNEALASRFMVINMPVISADSLEKPEASRGIRLPACGAVSGDPQEVRQLRDIHKGARPARPDRRRASHGAGTESRRGA